MTMTKERKPRPGTDNPAGGEPSKKATRSGAPLHCWIDPDVMAAVDEYVEESEPRVSKTAFVEAALKDLLRKYGCWPRQARVEEDE